MLGFSNLCPFQWNFGSNVLFIPIFDKGKAWREHLKSVQQQRETPANEGKEDANITGLRVPGTTWAQSSGLMFQWREKEDLDSSSVCPTSLWISWLEFLHLFCISVNVLERFTRSLDPHRTCLYTCLAHHTASSLIFFTSPIEFSLGCSLTFVPSDRTSNTYF